MACISMGLHPNHVIYGLFCRQEAELQIISPSLSIILTYTCAVLNTMKNNKTLQQFCGSLYVTANHLRCTVFVLLLFACTANGISFCSTPFLALVAIILLLVVPFNLVGAYLTIPKVVIIILKSMTSLCLSMLSQPALIQ